VKEAFVTAVEAALRLEDLPRVDELFTIVDDLPPGRVPQFLVAHTSRFRARAAALRANDSEADRLFRRSVALFRELDGPFYLAVALLEHGEWLEANQAGDESAALLAEAREHFERLGAVPWLERAAAVDSGRVRAVS
jgi:hypothetical protein